MSKSIKFLVHTVSSERDRNGNCYHFCTITRTSDRSKRTTFTADCHNSGGFLVRQLFGLDWSEVYETEASVSIRCFNLLHKKVTRYQHNVTKAMLMRGGDKD